MLKSVNSDKLPAADYWYNSTDPMVLACQWLADCMHWYGPGFYGRGLIPAPLALA